VFENKRIPNPKLHFKLEYDIKTDDKNVAKILEKIQEIISDEFNNADLVADVMLKLTKIEEE
jgi:hypothetical protein